MEGLRVGAELCLALKQERFEIAHEPRWFRTVPLLIRDSQ
jgi:hypothetical protein